MSEKDLWTMLFERGNAMQSFWTFYITVTFGIVALFGVAPRSNRLPTVIAVAFVCFAVVNCSGMYAIAKQRNALFKLLTSLPPAQPAGQSGTGTPASLPGDGRAQLVAASEPPTPGSVMAFHVLIDAGVLLGIWLLSRRA